MIFILITTVLFGLIVAILVVKWLGFRSYNQSPLRIKTFDGLNSPFHPSVLYFADGWNGWKYWMVETPFSPKCRPYVDRNECPSIHVSNDGKNWTEPTGLNNPLVNFGAEGEKNLDYYSDPHLVMRDGKMECWYRLTARHGDVDNRDKVSLRRIVSTDGVNWSDEEIISRLWENVDGKGLGKMVVSQALIYNPEEGYTMWYVNSEDHQGERLVVMSTSIDGIIWTNAQECNFSKTVNAWHIDVQIDLDGSLLMTVYDKKGVSLWKSSDRINWEYIQTMLVPSNKVGSFYCNGLYRSCIVCQNKSYQLFFSAYDLDSTHVGLAEFKSINEAPRIITRGNRLSFPQYIKYTVRHETCHYMFVAKHMILRCLSRL